MVTRVSVVAAAVAILLLAGCSLVPSAGTGGGGTDGSGGSGGSGGGTSDTGDTTTSPPGEVNLDDFEGLPTSFPTDEVPIVDGDIPVGVDLGTGWSLIVTVDDISSAFTEASGKLTGAGFAVTAENITDQGSIGVYANDKYQVNLTGADNPDYGPSLNYVVIKLG